MFDMLLNSVASTRGLKVVEQDRAGNLLTQYSKLGIQLRIDVCNKNLIYTTSTNSTSIQSHSLEISKTAQNWLTLSSIIEVMYQIVRPASSTNCLRHNLRNLDASAAEMAKEFSSLTSGPMS